MRSNLQIPQLRCRHMSLISLHCNIRDSKFYTLVPITVGLSSPQAPSCTLRVFLLVAPFSIWQLWVCKNLKPRACGRRTAYCASRSTCCDLLVYLAHYRAVYDPVLPTW